MLIYADHEAPFTGRPTPYHLQKATEAWARHYDNLLFLEAICRAPKDATERRQAEHELKICRRKMEHWEKHANFDQSRAIALAIQKKMMWPR